VRISSRSEYGLRAMVYLARRPSGAPVPLPEIARDEAIPTAFLERILAGLRRGGLVSATRGVYGGYQLARGPEEISVADVMAALEGPLSLVGCVPDDGGCERVDGCASREVWRRLDQAITHALTGITLRDLTTEATSS
jgi:Rrf2 family transcriptional regulator, cysteine metabolism repressor